jgi:PAS domain S-box-containing protein
MTALLLSTTSTETRRMSQHPDSFFLFNGEGEVKALLRNLDWSGSPLGHPSTWPRELAVAYDMVLHSAFPMFVAWGPQLGFLYNDAYARIMGAKHPAALGQRFESIWSEIWPDILPIIERALDNKSSYHEDLPLTVIRKGYPEPSFFTFAYSPLHDGDGKVGGMYCTVIETTARVQSERRAAFELTVSDALRPLTAPTDILERASALLGQQLGVDRVLYAEVDEERDMFFVARDWTGARLPSIAGQTLGFRQFGRSLPSLSRAGGVLAVEDTRLDPRTTVPGCEFAGHGVLAVLSVPLVKAGRFTAFLALHSATVRRWTEDEILLVRGMAERTWASLETARAQEELRRERDRSQYIFDTIAEGFLLLDGDFKVLQLNAEGERVAGLSAAQVLGRSHWEVWPESVDTEGGRMYRRVMQTGQAGAAEYCHDLPGGGRLWLDLRAYPTREGGIASFFRDITDRKLAQEKLLAADKRKDEFLAMLAHELRNPLAPISAAADLLKIGRLDEARVRQSSAIIARQVRHMTSLVDDLLDVSRVTRGLVTLAKAPVTARTIVDEAVEQVLPLVRARGQALAVRVEDGTATVLGDKARLVQVVANLLNNAARYTPEGRAIEVQAAAAGDSLVLTVRDDGIGMEPELSERVFELFAQGQRSADRSLGGLGLGLALVKHLVELHGGCVSCASPGPGQGSTFEIRLPVMRAAEPDGPAPHASGPARGARLKLMIVDDNVDAAETLGLLLEACGHEVAVEHQPLRALARARDLCPDVCLLDIGLPEVDGNELARRLRSQPETADTVLVAITGYGQERDRDQAFSAGFRHHLVKPVDMDKLAGVLAEIGPAPAR